MAGLVLGSLLLLGGAAGGSDVSTQTLAIRGQEQELHLYGQRGGPAAVVASGDGGWTHLGPAVAEFLAGQGWFVVGFDSKHYLSSFTHGSVTLDAAAVPGDFHQLVDAAGQGSREPPLLVGVSEGAALAVLAATDEALKPRVRGVLALGLPDRAELGWRFRDQIIYVTKGVPNEPTFSTAAVIGKVAPVPVAAIHSSQDEFVPVDEIKAVMARAGEPKQLWLVPARDHRFSDNQAELQRRLLEAIAWMRAQPR